MARSRNIKPGFFKNEILGVSDPLYSILFEGLWVLADRDGKLEDRPLRIKAETFPYREGMDVDAMLNWLQSNGFITRYTANGYKCIKVLEFVKHQNPHKNESSSELPDPSIECTKPEEIGTKPEEIGITRADSLSSDSFNLIPDNRNSRIAKSSAPPFVLPDWINQDHWSTWHETPKRRKATASQRQMAVNKLAAWRAAGDDFAGALENAALAGNQGLFLPTVRQDAKRYLPPQPNETVASKPGLDPVLAKLNAEAAAYKPPSPEMRAKLDALKRGAYQ